MPSEAVSWNSFYMERVVRVVIVVVQEHPQGPHWPQTPPPGMTWSCAGWYIVLWYAGWYRSDGIAWWGALPSRWLVKILKPSKGSQRRKSSSDLPDFLVDEHVGSMGNESDSKRCLKPHKTWPLQVVAVKASAMTDMNLILSKYVVNNSRLNSALDEQFLALAFSFFSGNIWFSVFSTKHQKGLERKSQICSYAADFPETRQLMETRPTM